MGSGMGKTSTRGHKGQRSRSGSRMMRGFDAISLLDFGIEHVVGIAERHRALIHGPLQIVIGAAQLLFGETARADILDDRDEMTHRAVLIENGRDAVLGPYDRTVRQHVADLGNKLVAGVDRVPKQIEFRDALPETLVGKVLRRVLLDEEKQKQAQAASS